MKWPVSVPSWLSWNVEPGLLARSVLLVVDQRVLVGVDDHGVGLDGLHGAARQPAQRRRRAELARPSHEDVLHLRALRRGHVGGEPVEGAGDDRGVGGGDVALAQGRARGRQSLEGPCEADLALGDGRVGLNQAGRPLAGARGSGPLGRARLSAAASTRSRTPASADSARPSTRSRRACSALPSAATSTSPTRARHATSSSTERSRPGTVEMVIHVW